MLIIQNYIMNNIYYLILCLLLISLAIYLYFRSDNKEMMYFRFSCENVVDVDYYDYINQYYFFGLFNQQLSNHLRLYILDHCNSLGIPYCNLQVGVQIDHETITISCYLEIDKDRYKYIQYELVKAINIESEVRKFYELCSQLRHTQYDNFVKIKEAH